MRQAHGLMVNYLYRLEDIEANHEALAQRGEVAASDAVEALGRREVGATAGGQLRRIAPKLNQRHKENNL